MLMSGYKSWFFTRPFGVNYLLDRITYKTCVANFIRDETIAAHDLGWDSRLLSLVEENLHGGIVCRPLFFSEVDLLRLGNYRNSSANLHVSNDMGAAFTGLVDVEGFDNTVNRDLSQDLQNVLLSRAVDVFDGRLDDRYVLQHTRNEAWRLPLTKDW